MNSTERRKSPGRKSPGLVRIWLGRAGRALDLLLPHSPRLIVAAALVALIAGAAHLVWQHVELLLSETPHYALRSQDIEITPPPSWVRADVKSEVIRDTSLDADLSVLDQDLANRLADAFTFHPWVKEVRQVAKQAGPHVIVDLAYRQPVAVVDTQVQDNADLLPVDIEGVRLPGEGFSRQEKKRFPRIVGILTQPLVGQQWNDPRVPGAARLAVLLRNVWEEFGLAAITLSQTPATSIPAETAVAAKHAIYELRTQSGTRILWGHAPDTRVADEPSDTQKLDHLRRSIRRPKVLPLPQVIDLRRESEIQHTARELSDTTPAAK